LPLFCSGVPWFGKGNTSLRTIAIKRKIPQIRQRPQRNHPMPNIAGVLKEEIRRLAKKEIKVQVGSTKKAAAQYRRDIAALKRQLGQQERAIKLLKKQQGQPQAEEEPLESVRYSARSVKAQRSRLGLSAADYGKLVGVGGLTIYNWEHLKARPRKAQLAALVAVRGIGKRDALLKLAELEAEKKKPRRKMRR
jgi:DNA-binding transcriptional regulator YiaG